MRCINAAINALRNVGSWWPGCSCAEGCEHDVAAAAHAHAMRDLDADDERMRAAYAEGIALADPRGASTAGPPLEKNYRPLLPPGGTNFNF